MNTDYLLSQLDNNINDEFHVVNETNLEYRQSTGNVSAGNFCSAPSESTSEMCDQLLRKCVYKRDDSKCFSSLG